MKVVLVTIFILIITFLSQQIIITVNLGNRTSVSIDLLLFSVTLYPDGGQGGNSKTFGSIRPAISALRFLLRHSSVSYTYIRGLNKDIGILRAIATPLGSVAAASFLAYSANRFTYSEKIDKDNDFDTHSFSVNTEVIFLPISLTIFIYLRIKSALRKRLENVG